MPLPSRRRPRRRQFNKPVRDKIPQIIRGHGEAARVARVRLADYPDLVKAKLMEEAFELFWEQEPKGLRRELADLLEVMRAICGVIGIGFEEVIAEADRRREERGGFDAGNILLETSPLPARARPVQPTLFDDSDTIGEARDEELVARRPEPEEPRGTRTGLTIPLVPPDSNHPQPTYPVRSGDGRLDVFVTYTGRNAIIRPAAAHLVDEKSTVEKAEGEASLFAPPSPE